MANALQSADSSTTFGAELAALVSGTGFVPLDDNGWIRATGSDRARWLNGMVTNAIQQLTPGEGCYCFVLNAQGRIQGDLTAFLEPDTILLETSREQVSALLSHFDRFIIMDDVELADISAQRSGILLAGPHAAVTLQKLNLATAPEAPLRRTSASWSDATIEILFAYSPLVPRIELWSDPVTIQKLTKALAAAGAIPISAEALEQLRILEGTPRYGVDIRDTATAHDLPQETGQTRALHFAKGCYLGQEIVERIRSRGNVHRIFSGFQLNGTLPPTTTNLQAEGKSVGELTSVATIQLPASPNPVQIALGYVRREALDRGLTLEYPGGVATPIALPYEGIS